MGIPLKFECGCEFDTWFTYDSNYDPVSPYILDCKCCRKHEKQLKVTYKKTVTKFLMAQEGGLPP